jgi:DNA-binding transcriptional MerR regulator
MTPEEISEDQSHPEPDEPIEPTGQPENESDLDPAEESEPVDEGPSGSKPEEQLQAILETAKSARLGPGDEERAVELLKQAIPGGPKALPTILEAILSLPWNAAVRAVTEAWPETKPAGRTRLLTGLAKVDTEVSRRIRLSLARGLHAQDPGAALKLISGVCEAMGGAQGGSTTKDRQVFANVMLGKARPWLMNVSMAEMKPADALKLITPALESCHQAPIFTQIWVLRWIVDAEKFDCLPPEHIDSIGKSINRWQPRWQKELRKIIPKLPESLETALANATGRPPAGAPIEMAAAEAHSAAPEAETDDEEEREMFVERTAEGPAVAQPPAEPRRSSRDRQQPGPFDLNRSLREIESYVAKLRGELQQAQAAARRREPAPDRHRGRAQVVAGSPEEIEELRRHNQQLEEQNLELRNRIEDLMGDHEDRAATLEIGDALQQFKSFLGLKLKEDFADYTAISRESLNEVVRRHAHEILGRIFTILQAEGVRFDQEK